MGIWNRLGNVINGYFYEFGTQTNRRFRSTGDPDFDAAYDELNDFLNDKEPRAESSRFRNERSENTGFNSASSSGEKLPPEELRDDFEKLGVPFGSDEETCKAAYKKLMKIHHPDRHVGHEGNFKKATERAARINASWDRIDKWRKGK